MKTELGQRPSVTALQICFWCSFWYPGNREKKPCAHLQQQVLPQPINHQSSASFKAVAGLILQCSGRGKAVRRSSPQDCSEPSAISGNCFCHTYRHPRVHVLARKGFQIHKCQSGGHQNHWNEQLCCM